MTKYNDSNKAHGYSVFLHSLVIIKNMVTKYNDTLKNLWLRGFLKILSLLSLYFG